MPTHFANAQNIDPKALSILKSSMKRVEDINRLSYSISYSYSSGNEKNVFVCEIGVSYISILTKDSVLYFLPQSNVRLDTKDSVFIYFENPTKYISGLAKKEYYTHGVYNIEKININDLLPKMKDLEGEFIDSIVFSETQDQDEYIIDEIHKPRAYNNGQVRSKSSFNRYWINKKTLLPSKRHRFFHSIDDLDEENINIDDFSLSFPERNPAPNFPIDIFKDNTLKNKKTDEVLDEKIVANDLIEKGMIAPNFSGKDILSQLEEDLNAYKGKVVLLDFWYLSCPPCRQLMPILNKLNKKYSNKDFIVLGVNFHDKNVDNIKNYIDKMSFSYKQWYLPSKEEKFYGIKSAPTTILIDKTGKIVFVEEGFYKDIEKNISQIIDIEVDK
ncbi:TlpA family protein disulfide reductase [Sphingobacterium spiritivorum]